MLLLLPVSWKKGKEGKNEKGGRKRKKKVNKKGGKGREGEVMKGGRKDLIQGRKEGREMMRGTSAGRKEGKERKGKEREERSGESVSSSFLRSFVSALLLLLPACLLSFSLFRLLPLSCPSNDPLLLPSFLPSLTPLS
jgi:hypothetical protein